MCFYLKSIDYKVVKLEALQAYINIKYQSRSFNFHFFEKLKNRLKSLNNQLRVSKL